MSEQFINIDLPSKGLVYDGIDMSKIKIRPFLGKEEVLLSELVIDNVKKKFITVLENVLQGIEPNRLTSGDAKYIMLWEAINSYTSTTVQKIVCEECVEPVDIVCDFKKINVVELPEDFKQPYTLQLSDREIQVRLLTVQDEMEAISWAKSGKSTYLFNYAKTIVNDTVSFVEKMDFLENLNTQDLKKIKDFHKKYEHGPDMVCSYKCPLCECEGKIQIPFRFDRLFPI